MDSPSYRSVAGMVLGLGGYGNLEVGMNEQQLAVIEQVLVKKLGQAMSFAAEELIQPKPASKPFVGLTDEDLAGCDDEELKQARYWEAKLREKNA